MIRRIYIRELAFSHDHNKDFSKTIHKLRVRYAIIGVPGEDAFQELSLFCIDPPPAGVDWIHDTEALKGKLLLRAIEQMSKTINDLRPEQTDFVFSAKVPDCDCDKRIGECCPACRGTGGEDE